MARVTELRTKEDVEAMIAASHERPLVLFKHSAACAGSSRMQDQVARLDDPGDPPRYVVVVQRARAASDYVAQKLGVPHETPQAIVIHEGRAVLHLSHGAIRTERLRDAARQAA
jgi:bacillithiol system protein YtxJ